SPAPAVRESSNFRPREKNRLAGHFAEKCKANRLNFLYPQANDPKIRANAVQFPAVMGRFLFPTP
ncbi:MAG: hypothetical protein ACPGVQ_06360, partial [Paracoccaceae bacterium]